MDTEGRGFGCRTLLTVLFVALLMGVLGGGVTGGVLTYYFIQQTPATLPAAVDVVPAAQNVPGTTPQTQVVQLQQNSAIVDAVKKVNPAVVTIVSTLTTQRPPSIFGPRTAPGQAIGTGVVIDPKGYIITNNHVIDGAQKIEILFESGDKVTATLVGADPFSDLAVLQVTGKTMPAVAQLGDSRALQVGEPVIAIGSALGDYQDTITVGVVSALNRKVDANQGSSLEGLIQTDAAINNGNSGGPLINAAGQVIGINTLVVRSDANGDVAEGLGFAIPSATVQQVSAELIAQGKVVRPFMGVSYTMLNPQLAAANDLTVQNGAWVQDVTAGSPAAQGGMQSGDIITAVNGQTLDENTPLVTALMKYKVGDTVQVTVQRNGQSLTLSVTLIERPANQ